MYKPYTLVLDMINFKWAMKDMELSNTESMQLLNKTNLSFLFKFCEVVLT